MKIRITMETAGIFLSQLLVYFWLIVIFVGFVHVFYLYLENKINEMEISVDDSIVIYLEQYTE